MARTLRPKPDTAESGDHRRISDGRWSCHERQLDAIDQTDCAGGAALGGPRRAAVVGQVRDRVGAGPELTKMSEGRMGSSRHLVVSC